MNGENPFLDIHCKFLNCLQGSDVWHQLRETSIGGSSIGTALDVNRFKSREDFILERVTGIKQMHTFNPVAMARGVMFEDLNRQLASAILGVPVYEEGICIHDAGMHFSPDGIGCDLKGNKFLLECKTVASRHVARSIAMINESYIYQMQFSMSMLPRMFNYAMYQDLNIVINTTNKLINNKKAVGNMKVYGTFKINFFVPSLPFDRIYTFDDIADVNLPDVMNGAIQTGPAEINLQPLGTDHINRMRSIVYQDDFDNLPLIRTYSTFKNAFMRTPNFTVTGIFGPIATFIIPPDELLAAKIREGCLKTIGEIEAMKVQMTTDGLQCLPI